MKQEIGRDKMEFENDLRTGLKEKFDAEVVLAAAKWEMEANHNLNTNVTLNGKNEGKTSKYRKNQREGSNKKIKIAGVSIMSAAVVVAAVLIVLFTFVWGADDAIEYNLGVTEGLLYEKVDGGYEVSIGQATDKNIGIPAEYNGLPVVKIANNGFLGAKIESVVLPDGLNKVGDNAFFECKKLKAVVSHSKAVSAAQAAGVDVDESQSESKSADSKIIVYPPQADWNKDVYDQLTPEEIEKANSMISDTVAGEYVGLQRSIRDNDGYFGASSFEACDELTELTIPDGVTTIGFRALREATSVKKVVMPDSVISVGDNAFFGATHVEEIIFSPNIVSVGSGAFLGTAWYNSQPTGPLYVGNILLAYIGEMPEVLTVREGTFAIATEFSLGAVIENDATSGRPAVATTKNIGNLKTVICNSDLKRIDAKAFQGCTGLSEIVLGDSLEYIGPWAFVRTQVKDISINTNSDFCLDTDALTLSAIENIRITAEKDVVIYSQNMFDTGKDLYVKCGRQFTAYTLDLVDANVTVDCDNNFFVFPGMTAWSNLNDGMNEVFKLSQITINGTEYSRYQFIDFMYTNEFGPWVSCAYYEEEYKQDLL